VTHLSRDELIGWRDSPADERRAAIVGHLAECGRCAAVYAELVRTRPSSAEPETLNPSDFVLRGRAAGNQSPRLNPRWFVPLAAAAGIVMAVFLFPRNPDPDTPVMRGGAALAPQAPTGTVDAVREFSWDGPADASYRLELSIAGGDLLHEARVRGTRYQLPPDVQARLKSGGDYQWTVMQLDVRGDIVEASRPATFTIR
jgi:hypothetical protein